ncbi:MAG: serine/threonine protein kinase [Phycisphaerales bacterium]|nr:MAG: serine/threonine protein kinase [Phycisphaerales bacterium]
MLPKRWQKVKEVFHGALERDTIRRAAFLDEVCHDDGVLRAEVESLIAAYESDPGFIERPALQDTMAPEIAGGDPLTDKMVGPYRLVRPIARGGMGMVYLGVRADDTYRRQVAVKLLRLDRFLDDPRRREELLLRFHTERQTLADLDSPNIAKLLDGGSTDDAMPYLVMDYVEGQPIDEYCDTQHLSIAERIELFRIVCRAVHYAHQHLVVHRDLKPSNILVTSEGTPKLLDFGIAKILQPDADPGAAQTQTGIQPLTPEYASPEQVRGERTTTASDIYSLGVVLYELLTGHRPCRLSSVPQYEVPRAICEQQPEKPSTVVMLVEEEPTRDGSSWVTLTPQSVSQTREGDPDRLRRRLSGDIDMIVLKALRKEPDRRYTSVEQFSEDIRRHLEGLPVIARPDTLAYRVSKFVRRHAVGVGLTTMMVLTLVAATAIATMSARDAQRQRDAAVAAERHATRLAESESTQRRLAEQAEDEAESVTQFLSEMLAAVDPAELGKDVSVRQVLDEASKTVGERFGDKPLIEARLRYTIGNAYYALGLFDRAETHQVSAARTYRRILGEEHPSTLESMDHLAHTLYRQGKWDESASAHRRTLEIKRRVLGEEHPDTLVSMNNLGLALRDEGKWAEAEELHRRALELQLRVLGEEHPSTLASMSNLANMVSDQGKLSEAETLYRRALEIQRRALGEEHVNTLAWMNNLANTLNREGKWVEAEELTRRALEIQRRVLGEEHPNTTALMNNLAITLHREGRWVEAEELDRRALEIQRRVLGEEHPWTLGSMVILATTFQSQGKLVEAEELNRRALEITCRVYSEEHPWALGSMAILATVLRSQGRLVEAEELQRKTLEIKRRVLGEEHPDALESMNNLGSTLRDAGKWFEAEELQRRTLEIRRRVLGEEHPSTLASMNNLAETLTKQKKLAEVEELHRRILDLRRRRASGPQATAADLNRHARLLLTCEPAGLRDPEAALLAAEKAVNNTSANNCSFLDTLALAYQATGEIAKAVETQRQAISLLPPEESPLRTRLEVALAEYLIEQGDYLEAESLLLNGISNLRGNPYAQPEQEREVVERIVRLYEAWGKPDKAAEYHATPSADEPAPPNNAWRSNEKSPTED